MCIFINNSCYLTVKNNNSLSLIMHLGNTECRLEGFVAVTLARPLHVSKVGQSKKERASKRHLKVTSVHMEVRAFFGRDV